MNSLRGSKVGENRPISGILRRSRASVDDEDEDSGNKRQRTALACNSCRHRKSRCNGERPVCSTCRDWGLECVYRGPAPGPKPQSKEMQSMADRLRHVEDLLLAIVGSQEGNTNSGAVIRSSHQAESADIISGGQSSASLYSRTNVNHAEQPGDHEPDDNTTNAWPAMHESTVDGMVSITFADESSSGYFGPSSNSAFIGHVSRALASGTGTFSEGRDTSQDLTSNMSRPASPPLPSNRIAPKQVNPYRLPPQAEILRLVDKFFSITGQFFPYISKTNLLQMVDEIEITTFSGGRKSWFCLLNAILAIGTSLDVDNVRQTKFREAESDVFFQRALTLLPLATSHTDNLETVQALAVMTQYLQGTSKSTQTWRLHGLLVQAALQVGVHAKDVSGKRSAFEQESRTRTWYTCVILDRMLSMTFGRPALIHDELIQIDLPQDVELDSLPKDNASYENAQQSPSGSSPCGIFIASINLYRIQGNIIGNIYNHNVISSHTLRSDELCSKIVTLDYELNQWKRNLPLNMALVPLELLEAMEIENWAYTRTQTVLTLRYLNSRTLLFRKMLEQMLKQGTEQDSTLNYTDCMPLLGDAMVQTCTMMATYTITLIHKVRTRPDLLPAWWFTTYYVFNSAMMIFGAICLRTLSRFHASWKPLSELMAYLKIALEALDVIGGYSAIVRRCSKYLKKMIQVVALLVRHQTSAQATDVDGPTAIDLLSYENLSTTTSENTHSPLQADLGQLLLDEDFSFLDFWTDAAQQSNI